MGSRAKETSIKLYQSIILQAICDAYDDNMIVYDQDCPNNTITKRLLFAMHNVAMDKYTQSPLVRIFVPTDTYSEVEWDTSYMNMVIIPMIILNKNNTALELYSDLGGCFPNMDDNYNRLVVGQCSYGPTICGACKGPED